MSKLYLYLIAGLVVVVLVGGGAWTVKRVIEKGASAQLAIDQLTQSVKEQRENSERIERIMRLADESRIELERQLEESRAREREILDSIDGMQDRESSDVLKQTFRSLAR